MQADIAALTAALLEERRQHAETRRELEEMKKHDCSDATQEFRLRNDAEWRLKVDWQKKRAETAEAALAKAREALDLVAGDGRNTRYCGCEHLDSTWLLGDKQKEIARAFLAALEAARETK